MRLAATFETADTATLAAIKSTLNGAAVRAMNIAVETELRKARECLAAQSATHRLAVRSFAPLVETHRSLADVSAHVCANASFAEASFSPSFGDTWVVFSPSRRVVCDPSRLVAAATAWCGAGASPCTWPTVRDTSTEEAVAEVDHPFEVMTASGQAATPRNASSTGRRHVNADGAPYVQQTRATLYGRLGSALFWEFHDELVRLSTEGIVDRYVLYSSISAFRGCCCHRWRHPASFYGDLIRSFF